MKAILDEEIDRRILHVLRLIEANRSVDVGKLARIVNLNPSYLGRLFKAAIGISIVQYSIELRMKHARHLFLTTDWAVKRIAIECGIPDGSNFVRYFKRRFGVVPSEFRKNYGSETNGPAAPLV